MPYGTKREPKDVFEAKAGLCYDRSRVIEKILNFYGFKTRHVAIYSTVSSPFALLSLVTPGINSHAVTEVKTSKGWLVVDSNELFLSVGKDNEPISIEEIQTSNITNSTLAVSYTHLTLPTILLV